jgi:hypothetical protein
MYDVCIFSSYTSDWVIQVAHKKRMVRKKISIRIIETQNLKTTLPTDLLSTPPLEV